MDNNPNSLENQNPNQATAGMIQKWQIPNGLITPLALAATPTTAKGDQYYVDANGIFARLPIGSTNQILTTIAGLPAWRTPAAIPTVPTDGWTADSHTWTYASASTFTIAGVDLTSVFTKGTRLKFTNSGQKYGVVVSSAFSTDTTVTIAVNTDYVIANAAISAPSYSYQVNPQGYPGWFNYTVTWTGFSADPSSGITRFAVMGKVCFVQIDYGAAGTSNTTGLTFTLPIVAGQTVFTIATPLVVDNSTAQTSPGRVDLTASSNIATVYKTLAQTGWTNSGTKNAICNFFYEI